MYTSGYLSGHSMVYGTTTTASSALPTTSIISSASSYGSSSGSKSISTPTTTYMFMPDDSGLSTTTTSNPISTSGGNATTTYTYTYVTSETPTSTTFPTTSTYSLPHEHSHPHSHSRSVPPTTTSAYQATAKSSAPTTTSSPSVIIGSRSPQGSVHRYMFPNGEEGVKCSVPHCTNLLYTCYRHSCPHCGAIKSSKTPACAQCQATGKTAKPTSTTASANNGPQPPAHRTVSPASGGSQPRSSAIVWIPEMSVTHCRLLFETRHSALYRCSYEGIPAMQKVPTRQENQVTIFKEWELHSIADRHPNVVRVYGMSRKSNGEVSMITELLDCDLTDRLLHASTELPQQSELLPTLMFYLLQAARGLRHIHRCGLLHRDVGTNNMLMDGKLLLKISDFGLARRQNDLTPTGLPYPMSTPPEALRTMDDLGVWTTKCDVWQFGLAICDVMGLGKNCLAEFNFNVQALLDALDKNWLPERPALCPDSLWKLVLQCLQQDPTLRPEFDEIVEKLEMMAGAHHHHSSQSQTQQQQSRATTTTTTTSTSY